MAGAPGSGKTTLINALQKRLDCPRIDFGRLREFHLDTWWKKANEKEEKMTFSNLVFIIKNYFKNKYNYVIVDDLKKDKVKELSKLFKNSIIFTLVLNDNILKKRLKNYNRDSGFRDVNKAIKFNLEWKNIKLNSEYKIENSQNNPNKIVNDILKILKYSK